MPKTKAMFIASRNAANRSLENNQDLKLSDETINITTNDKALGCPFRQYFVLDCS